MEQANKARKLGKGLAGLMGMPVAVPLPPQAEPAVAEDKKSDKSNVTVQIPSSLPAAGGAAPATKAPVAAPKVEKAETAPPRATTGVSGGATAQPSAPVAARTPSWPTTTPAPNVPAASPPVKPIAATAAPAPESATAPSPYVVVRVDEVIANRFQPRQEFDEPSLAALAASIKRDGMMQPLVVRKVKSGAAPKAAQWELIAGERRWRAAKVAGLTRVPAVVVEIDDVTAALWAVVENVQRVDLGALEKSAAYTRLSKEFGLTQQQIADQVGEDRTLVSHYIRLGELEPRVVALIRDGSLTFGHAKVLNSPLVKPGEVRTALAERAARETLSVRQLEVLVQRGAGKSVEDARATSWSPQQAALAAAHADLDEAVKDAQKRLGIDDGAAKARAFEARANVRDLEEQIGKHLGTKVRIKTSGAGKRGVISLEYYSLDHFDGLVSKMGVKRES